MNNKLLSYSTPVLLIAIFLLLLFGGRGAMLGGTTNFDQIDTTEGYSVDGTSIINGSGAFIGTVTGTITTANTATFSGTATFATTSWSASTTGPILRASDSTNACYRIIITSAAIATTSASCY